MGNSLKLMKLGLRLGVMVWLGTLTGLGQVAAPPPTLDREVEGKARRLLQPPATVAAPVPAAAAAADQPVGTTDLEQVDFLFGVVILKDRSLLKVEGVPRGKPVQVPESDRLLNSQKFKEIILRHCQKPINSRLMAELQREIIQFYHTEGHMLVDVLYEEQDVSSGMLQVMVLEAKLKQIRMQDKNGHPYTNGFSDPLLLKKSLFQKEGQPVLTRDVYADLDWLNRNPFRKVQPLFEPGGGFAESDLLLRIDDRRPFEVSLGYDNTGSEETGEDRLSAGFTWGKAFGLQDHLFSYQFTASPDFEGLRAHVASYTMPLPWRHVLRVFGSYVDVTGDLQSGKLEGTSYQASLRYDVPLPALGQIRHEFSAGLDFKHSDNSLIFGVSQPVNTPTEIFQTVFGYTAGLADGWGQSALAAQLVYSPGGVTDLNTDPNFDASHRFSTANYFYGRFTAERETRLWRLLESVPDESGKFLRWNLRGLFQLADGNLLASEQLGLGGYATVRGYDERQVSIDQGWLISNELKSPALTPAKWMGLSKVEDRLEFLFFWDYAVGGNKELITVGSGEPDNYTLSSVGPGVRYAIGRHLTFRFDYGFPLTQTGIDPTRKDEPRAHFGLNLSY